MNNTHIVVKETVDALLEPDFFFLKTAAGSSADEATDQARVEAERRPLALFIFLESKRVPVGRGLGAPRSLIDGLDKRVVILVFFRIDQFTQVTRLLHEPENTILLVPGESALLPLRVWQVSGCTRHKGAEFLNDRGLDDDTPVLSESMIHCETKAPKCISDANDIMAAPHQNALLQRRDSAPSSDPPGVSFVAINEGELLGPVVRCLRGRVVHHQRAQPVHLHP